MRDWFGILRRHRVVRASAAAIFLYGFAGAATSPYQSVVAIRDLGLSDRAYAALALAASVANVSLSIALGLLSDRLASYRRPLIFASAFGILGYGMIWLLPSTLTFILAALGPLALFHATNAMLFGSVRAHADNFSLAEANIVNALMRMMVSLSWVLVPGIVGLALRGQESMIAAWGIAAAAAAACTATVVFWLPPDHTGRPARAAIDSTRQPALQDLAQLVRWGVLLRVAGVALISQVLHVNGAALPLIVTGQAGGRAEDIGFLVGIVAVIEVVFMVFWARVTPRLPVMLALLICAGLYLCYLSAIAMATAPWHVYAASLVGGFAAAGIISLPIGYLLDLIRDRPGLSASLIAVNMFAGGALGAAAFALGTAIAGYPGAAVLSGIWGVAGAGILLLLERRGR